MLPSDARCLGRKGSDDPRQTSMIDVLHQPIRLRDTSKLFVPRCPSLRVVERIELSDGADVGGSLLAEVGV